MTSPDRGSTGRDDAEVRYRALFETMGPAVLLMRGPACIDCNPATLALFGVDRREDMLGKTPLDFAPPVQPNGQASADLVQQNVMLALKHGTHTFEWQSLRRSGEPFLMEVRFTPCGPPEDQLFLCIAVDISERRLTEAERLRTQKLEALGVLAGGIAHDFNNLLQGIMSSLGTARLASTLADARARLGETEEALQMAARLTSQLLTFARGGALPRRAVALGPLLQRTARLATGGTQVACEFDLAGDLWPVEADEGQLDQVVHNLVLNAAQAMAGGGTVHVVARNVSTLPGRARSGHAGPFVAISVQDAGGGIPEAVLARIFDPYFTTKAGGSGLGLTTAYSVVQRHDGWIDVQTTEGKGSTFTVYLPKATSAAQPDARLAPRV